MPEPTLKELVVSGNCRESYERECISRFTATKDILRSYWSVVLYGCRGDKDNGSVFTFRVHAASLQFSVYSVFKEVFSQILSSFIFFAFSI